MTTIRKTWKAGQISKEVGAMGRVSPEDEVFHRVWSKVEGRLEDRKKHSRGPLIWKPWAHPGGWVLLAACLCAILTAIHYQRTQADNKDLVSYLMTISNTNVSMNGDDDGVKVPLLLTGPSAEINDNFSLDEDQPNVLQEDEIFL